MCFLSVEEEANEIYQLISKFKILLRSINQFYFIYRMNSV